MQKTMSQKRNSFGTILVVDDEKSVRVFMKKALEHFGYTVLLAKDGQEGVEIFQQNKEKIKAVVLDMTMPKMNGFEAFCIIRLIRNDVPVILATAFSEEEIADLFPKDSLAGHLKKPFKLSELESMIHEAIFT